VTARAPFDFVETCRALARTRSPEKRQRIIDGDPTGQAQRLADRLDAIAAKAPPLTSEQREGIRAVFRGGGGR
jgi:hypothetical protein